MKTLDEVIKAIEWCTDLDQSGCNVCPYGDGGHVECYQEDALHYLREYRNKQDEDWRQSYIAVRNEILFGGDPDDNPPLTWNELKQMEGKPVWVERPEWKEWLLISEIDKDKYEIYLRDKWGNGVSVNARNVGYWQAYRKENTNGTN